MVTKAVTPPVGLRSGFLGPVGDINNEERSHTYMHFFLPEREQKALRSAPARTGIHAVREPCSRLDTLEDTSGWGLSWTTTKRNHAVCIIVYFSNTDSAQTAMT